MHTRGNEQDLDSYGKCGPAFWEETRLLKTTHPTNYVEICVTYQFFLKMFYFSYSFNFYGFRNIWRKDWTSPHMSCFNVFLFKNDRRKNSDIGYRSFAEYILCHSEFGGKIYLICTANVFIVNLSLTVTENLGDCM